MLVSLEKFNGFSLCFQGAQNIFSSHSAASTQVHVLLGKKRRVKRKAEKELTFRSPYRGVEAFVCLSLQIYHPRTPVEEEVITVVLYE